MKTVYTPLRYPGGKARLSSYFKALLRENSLLDSHYVEPYAGGAGIALSLLMTDYCSHIHLNDISYPLFCFWKTALTDHEYLCKHIKDTSVSPSSWDRQKAILKRPKLHSASEIGYAFFFLNRTNRSGIQNAGMIGGRKQSGIWQIDARFNKPELIRRIECIAEHRNRISIYNLDAADFIKSTISKLPKKSLVYFDPPYYVKGRRLYADYYAHDDHAAISNNVQSGLKHPWVVTYDNHPSIIDLYCDRRRFIYNLGYSAHTHRVGTEVMFFSDQITIPEPEFEVVDTVLKPMQRLRSSASA
ncbi:MAG: DNA adenine methylase [Pseudomonadota bacterium]